MPSSILSSPAHDSRERRLLWVLGQFLQDIPKRRDWLNPEIEEEARDLVACLPAPEELAACLDGTSVLNLTKLHDLVIDHLMKLKSSAASPSTFERFRQHILEFAVQSGFFTTSEAVRWYTQPVAEWNLIENADRSEF